MMGGTLEKKKDLSSLEVVIEKPEWMVRPTCTQRGIICSFFFPSHIKHVKRIDRHGSQAEARGRRRRRH